jgi:hypothetical protein
MGFRIERDPEAFSLDKPTKRRDRKKNEPFHLRFIRDLPCLVCSSRIGVEAAHIRYRDAAHGKPGTAMAQKPDDQYCVPLCKTCHRQGSEAQHNANERDWWQRQRIDPVSVAEALYAVSGNHDEGFKIIKAFE